MRMIMVRTRKAAHMLKAQALQIHKKEHKRAAEYARVQADYWSDFSKNPNLSEDDVALAIMEHDKWVANAMEHENTKCVEH